MKQSFRFVVAGYVDGKKVLANELSAPRNAPATWEDVAPKCDRAYAQVMSALDEALGPVPNLDQRQHTPKDNDSTEGERG